MAAADPKGASDTEHLLSIAELLDWLVEDKMVDAAEAAKMKKERRYYRGTQHPLTVVADMNWKSALPPPKPLALEPLTEWLAKRVGLEYLHIDPLKIDFAAVTEVMSSAYATRFRILPVGLNTKEAVIATAEPWDRAWERELAPILKLEIRRVIANPEDIERYQVEFYNLAKSVKGAARGAGADGAGTASSTQTSAPCPSRPRRKPSSSAATSKRSVHATRGSGPRIRRRRSGGSEASSAAPISSVPGTLCGS
jgi:general secretion pathway protein E